MRRATTIALILLVALPSAAAQVPLWQVNQSGAYLGVDNFTNNAFSGPLVADLFPGTPHTLTISGTSGQPFEIYSTQTAAVPGSPTFGLQFVNLDLTHPSFTYLYGPPEPLMGSGVSIPFTLTTVIPTSALQMLVLDPAAIDGWVLSAAIEVASPPAGIYVDGDSTGGGGNGSFTQPFPTIAQALAVAAPFDTIHVDFAAAGYVENLVVQTQGVTIIGDRWAQPFAPRPVIASVPGVSSGYTIEVFDNISNVTIEGLEVHPGTYDGTSHGIGPAFGSCITLWNGASNVTIRDCVLTGSNLAAVSGTWGVRAEGGNGGISIRNCRFENLDHVENGAQKNVIAVFLNAPCPASILNCEFAHLGETHQTNDGNVVIRAIDINGGTSIGVANNLFRDVMVPASDLGMGPDPSLTVANCAALVTTGTALLSAINNTMVNWDLSNAQGGAMINGFQMGTIGDPSVINNILSDAVLPPTGGAAIGLSRVGAAFPAVQATYGCVDISWTIRHSPPSYEDVTTTVLSPGYTNFAAGDYTLGVGSACIDSGDPTLPDADATPGDRGCYGGLGSALPVGTL